MWHPVLKIMVNTLGRLQPPAPDGRNAGLNVKDVGPIANLNGAEIKPGLLTS